MKSEEEKRKNALGELVESLLGPGAILMSILPGDSVTHVAGPVVCINNRVIQRCMVCGEKLGDNARVMMPVGPDGHPQPYPTWNPGALVQVEGNRSSEVGHFNNSPLPWDFCLELVEV
jgi:hypothetical protein